MNQLKRMLIVALIIYITLLTVVTVFQRRMIYYPSHHSETNGLAPWIVDGRTIGYARKANNPKNVWLFTHGNGGQAADRAYALQCFSDSDSVFILEYPGYGNREGSPGKLSFNSAAEVAYRELRRNYLNTPVCVVGESIGSGPASSLAKLQRQPDKIVLVVPFDTLTSVARDHFPLIPAGLLLFDRWDNIDALEGYTGKLEIYGAIDDRIIPTRHARALAKSLPLAVFNEIRGGHNDWSQNGEVKIRN
jgi:pimeloyl-ACP methyl ester carboxylesterase